MKYCIGCKHFRYDKPEEGYHGSSYTGTYGNEEAALACQKGHWRTVFDDSATVDTFAKAMETAETCSDYEERDLEAEERERQAAIQRAIKERLAYEEAEKRKPLYCSFCGDSGRPVVVGPGVFICSLCVQMSQKLFESGKTATVKGDLG